MLSMRSSCVQLKFLHDTQRRSNDKALCALKCWFISRKVIFTATFKQIHRVKFMQSSRSSAFRMNRAYNVRSFRSSTLSVLDYVILCWCEHKSLLTDTRTSLAMLTHTKSDNQQIFVVSNVAFECKRVRAQLKFEYWNDFWFLFRVRFSQTLIFTVPNAHCLEWPLYTVVFAWWTNDVKRNNETKTIGSQTESHKMCDKQFKRIRQWPFVWHLLDAEVKKNYFEGIILQGFRVLTLQLDFWQVFFIT